MDIIRDNRTIIIENSIRLFYEQGYEKTTMRKIAKASGLSHPSIYNHFKKKEDLSIELLKQYINGVVIRTEQYIEDHPQLPTHDAFLFYWTIHLHFSRNDERYRLFQLEQHEYAMQILELESDYLEQLFIHLMHWDLDDIFEKHTIYLRVLNSIVLIATNTYIRGEITLSLALSELFDLVYLVLDIEKPVDESYIENFVETLDMSPYLAENFLEEVLLAGF